MLYVFNDPAEVASEQRRMVNAMNASGSHDDALRELRESIRKQIVLLCEQEISAKSLGRLQRFCSAMGTALLALEKPEHLVRDRFGSSPVLDGDSSDPDTYASAPLAKAPPDETYGANMSRSLIAEAAKLGKEIVEAQVAGQAANRKLSSLPELVTSLVLAKRQRLGKSVISAIEKQIEEASASVTK
jgi:hypothetical protein